MQCIAKAGSALGGIQPAMQEQRAQAAQNLLRTQQLKTSQVEMQGKQADIAQQAQWRAYAASPEFKAAMDSANATPAERMAATVAAMKGDFKTVATVLDQRRNDPKVSGRCISYPGGWVGRLSDLTGEMTQSPGARPPPTIGSGWAGDAITDPDAGTSNATAASGATGCEQP